MENVLERFRKRYRYSMVVFKELVKKVLISNTAIQFELINGMKLSESRAAT